MNSDRHVYPNYALFDVNFARGFGEFLYDEAGKEYIDLIGGIAVTCVGHCHPKVVARLKQQAEALWQVSNFFKAPWQSELADRLIRLSEKEGTQLSRVYFCNSGTEASEAAFKLARIYGQRISKRKFQIVSLEEGFHGRTLAAACLTGQKKGQELMGPLPEGFPKVPANNMAALESAIHKDTCAFFVEAVLGDGGVLPLDRAYLERAQELCKKHQALFVCDEVQAGNFRSGSFWCHQRFGLMPDMVATAKGLGGGFPIGALLTSEKLRDVLTPGVHGSTFGGNPLAANVASAVLEVLEEENVSERVIEMEGFLRETLGALQARLPSQVLSTRGMGLLWGVILREDLVARDIVNQTIKQGLVMGLAGKNILRLAPSLLIQKSSVTKAVRILEEVLSVN